MTASPEDRPDEVADSASTPTKKTTARKAPVKKKTTPRTSPRAAAEDAAATGEVVIEPVVKQTAAAPAKKPAASAARAAAAKNSARTTSARGARATTSTARAAAARTAAAKAADAKTTASEPTAAKSTTAKSTTAKSATAARTAAAKAATERNAAAKTTARTASARSAAAKTAAAKAAATKAAKAEAARVAREQAVAAEVDASAVDITGVDPHELAEPAAISVEETPVEKAPAEEKAAPEFPGEEASLEQAAVAEVPVAEVPVAEASVEEAPVEEESVEEAPVEEAPADGSAVTEPEIDDAVVASDDTTDVFVPLVHEHVEVDSSVDEGAGPRDDVASASGAEAIRIRGLVKTFGDHTAVNGIDLTVPAGSFYGIVGPNGAGKTTTLSIVAGLLRADRGDVVICGVDQKSKPLAAKRMMGVLPDRLRTFDRLTGRQLLHYYGLLRGLASDVIEKRVGDLARAFDLGDALNRVVSDYSAGMTKKIMLAGAMIHSPRVLVLDEPFEAVDPVSSAVILDILRAYVAHGGTVILSSHGMDLVERVCSRVAIIVGGDVLAEGTIDEVRAGQTLEARFVELSGGIGEVEGLEWLHTFSD